MRVAIYARVSSTKQRDAQTIQSQLSTLPVYARAQGWEVVETYADDGKTAKAGHLEARTEFARLIRDAQARRFELVLVVDLDRLTRTDDLVERGQIYGSLQRAGVRIATPSLGIVDLGTFLGDLYTALQSVVAAEENRKRTERVMRGKIEAAKRGKKPAGPTPYGYVYSREKGEWSLHPSRSKVVLDIFRRATEGISLNQIADELNAQGVPRPRLGVWTGNTVRMILVTRSWLGEYTVDKGRGLVVKVPKLMSEEQWQAAQAIIAKRPHFPSKTRRHFYLLAGCATCGLCGSRIACFTGAGRRRDYYVCSQRLRSRDAKCEGAYFRAQDTDDQVWDATLEFISKPDIVQAMLGVTQESAVEADQWAKDVEGYQRHLARLDRVAAQINSQYRRGNMTDAVYSKEVEASARERRVVQHNLDVAMKQAEKKPAYSDEAESLQAAVEHWKKKAAIATPALRREVLFSLIDRFTGVELGPDRDVITLRLGLGAERICQAIAVSCNSKSPTYKRIPLILRAKK